MDLAKAENGAILSLMKCWKGAVCWCVWEVGRNIDAKIKQVLMEGLKESVLHQIG